MQEAGLLDGATTLKAYRPRMTADASGNRMALGTGTSVGTCRRVISTRRCGRQVRNVFWDGVTRSNIGDPDI